MPRPVHPLSSSPFPEPSCQQDSICSVLHFVIACVTNMVRDKSTDVTRTFIEPTSFWEISWAYLS